MEPKDILNMTHSISINKQCPINIRFVSNHDKENISSEIIFTHNQNNQNNQIMPSTQINKNIFSQESQSRPMMNQFETNIDQLSKKLMPLLLDNISPSLENLSRPLKKTNSVSTLESEISDSSLRTVQNQQKGYSISDEDQGRVFQDITHCFYSVSDHKSDELRNSLGDFHDIDFLNESFSNDDDDCHRMSELSIKFNISSKENPKHRTSLIAPIKYKKRKINSNKNILANRKRNTLKLR